MYKYLIEKAGDFDWIATSLLLLFFAIFLFGNFWILLKNKGYLDKMSNLPLEETHPQNPEI